MSDAATTGTATEHTARKPAPRRPERTEEPLGGAESGQLFERFFGARRRILLAVSGGADSTAMLVLAAEWADKRGRPLLHVATVDHGLRVEVEEEIEAVARLSADFELPHARLTVKMPARPSRIEETARRLRYAALIEHARAIGAEALATAHTLDDQAETVLMRIAAGTGPAGLAAMRPEAERDGLVHLRPFLGVAKGRLIASLDQRVRRWAEDAMNADPRYVRARLRTGRALLEREGLTSERLGVLAHRMGRVNEALNHAVDAAAAAHLTKGRKGWAIAPGAAALPDEIKLRLLRRAIEAAGDGHIRLDRLERLADRIVSKPSGASTLGGACVAWSESGEILTSAAPPRRGLGAKRKSGL